MSLGEGPTHDDTFVSLTSSPDPEEVILRKRCEMLRCRPFRFDFVSSDGPELIVGGSAEENDLPRANRPGTGTTGSAENDNNLGSTISDWDVRSAGGCEVDGSCNCGTVDGGGGRSRLAGCEGAGSPPSVESSESETSLLSLLLSAIGTNIKL